jgi:hypothetical protein
LVRAYAFRKKALMLLFVGGTGVLVFMDLIALMFRQNLGLFKEKGFLNMSSFKFVLYASFPSRKDAIGIDLLEGLDDVTKTLGLKNFHLELRFSNENRF